MRAPNKKGKYTGPEMVPTFCDFGVAKKWGAQWLAEAQTTAHWLSVMER